MSPDPVRDDTKVDRTKKTEGKKILAKALSSKNPCPVERCVESIKKEIVAILKQHRPDALKALDRLLENYAGREEDLLREAKEKY